LPFAFQAQDERALVAAGSKLFTPTCSNGYCHGPGGSGGGGPALRGRNFSPAYLTRVIEEGVPGTAMRGFKEDYTKEQIRQLVAYIMSLSQGGGADASAPSAGESTRPAAPKTPTKTELAEAGASAASADPLALRGEAEAGRALFFDAANERSCRACHSFQGRGGKVGPDLSQVGGKTARELLQSIVLPHAAVDPAYAPSALTTRTGERVIGLKREEDDEVIKLLDISSLPPVARTFQKADLAQIERLSSSVMPGDYASRYTLKQLLDLIAFLKATGPDAPTSVSLKDLF
jgi:predicted CxxxxCH...CXXCH cytochrome family protein